MGSFVFLQARMGSKRLPGKSLLPIRHYPLIYWAIERLRLIRDTALVLLTSNTSKDDPIFEWCCLNDIDCFRGSESNVLKRYCDAADFYDAENIIRATGDNPLVEPYLATALVTEHVDGNYDYSSNKSEVMSGLPEGLGVEIFSKEALAVTIARSTEPHHFEHVNEYILENPDQFRILRKQYDGDLFGNQCLKLSVDTTEDFNRLDQIISDVSFSTGLQYKQLMDLV